MAEQRSREEAEEIPNVHGRAGASVPGREAEVTPRGYAAYVEQRRLDAQRDRLYSRTQPLAPSVRHSLSREAVTSPHRIDDVPLARPPVLSSQSEPPPTVSLSGGGTTVSMPTQQSKTGLLSGVRGKILGFTALFFVVALILSGSFIFFGQNTISGNNIAIDVQAPSVVGGGTEFVFSVAVTNRNAVAVDSATLIIEYPQGTQETDIPGKELFRQRVQIGSLKSGEVLNIPAKAKLFGEENEEKRILISVEYRVQGSNATFFKEADPLIVRVTSSPVSISIDGVKEISSGQELALTLTLTSNSTEPLADLLVQATYPTGFDFSTAEPKPIKGQNIWSVDSLQPSAKKTIVLKGVMVGGSAEERTFNFSVGVANEHDRFALASVLSTASAGVTLANPFAGLSVEMNGSTNETLSLQPRESATVSIKFKNTLADTLYHTAVKVTLSGNGLNASSIDAPQGFFDSSSNTIIWDESQVSGLRELAPGAEQVVSFAVRGANIDATRTPQVSFDVSVSGRRVSETRVPQELTNLESRMIRFASMVSLTSQGWYSIGPFSNTGPMPPKAETLTQYAIMLGAENGSNELSDATVSMTLPQYVSWQGVTSSGSNISYNASTREVTWYIGSLAAHVSTNAAFQVGFLPSLSQVGTVPSLVSEQRLRATDRFTGTVVRATAPGFTTALPDDPAPDAQSGRVAPK